MIGQIVDQIQKLFGRVFFIAYFIPSLLFVVIVCYLGWGGGVLIIKISNWVDQGWKQVIIQLLLALTAVYLLAYLLYGIRYFLQQMYQGEWRNWPLSWLKLYALKLQVRSLTKHEATVDAHLESLSDIYWASEWDFGDSPTQGELDMPKARQNLEKAKKLREEIVQRIERQKDFKKRDFERLLHLSRELNTSCAKLKELNGDIKKLVESIKTDYNKYNVLKDAADILAVRRLREWDTAKDYFGNNFPDSERWLRATRLGNIVVVQELYPLNRYGISLSALWPRLYHVIPQNARLHIEDASIYADFTIVMSFLSFLASSISIVCASTTQFRQLSRYIKIPGPMPFEFSLRILFPLFFIVIAWIFYRAAIQATLALGIQIQAAIDLFRLKLLDALDIVRPVEAEKEIKIWESLSKFFASAEIPRGTIKYKIPESKPAVPPSPTSDPERKCIDQTSKVN